MKMIWRYDFYFILLQKMRIVMNNCERIIIENPPKKVLDFVEKMRETKRMQREALLEKKTHTFSVLV